GGAATELLALVHSTLRESLGKDYPWPGNVRELEQAVRRILLTRSYQASEPLQKKDLRQELAAGIDNGTLEADELLSTYCALLYETHGTYEAVSRRTKLDYRTVKKYLRNRRC